MIASFLVGIVAGLRSMTPLAAVSLLARSHAIPGGGPLVTRLRDPWVLAVKSALALRLTYEHGTPTLALVSAAGANPNSRFLYPRVKGDTERDASALGFGSVTIVRPALIAGVRAGDRPVERAAVRLARAIHPILPRGWRVNPAERMAGALVNAATQPLPGHYTVMASDLA